MPANSAERNERIIASFRSHGGDVPLENFGKRLILLHHCGNVSGREYVTPLVALRDDEDTWFIAASAGGTERHPAWYLNLTARPRTTIETPDGVESVSVIDLDEPERSQAWAKFESPLHNVEHANFRSYQERTSRTIPVVALRRATEVPS
ncbi:hypothetical protein BOH66_06330 [Microbacterium aurum]|uniref:Nitroreductase family deazaflavin-dependent oxidoreductase n=1 Tax=Microbacterium aurum TaxID=36805 RepID=A0A1P8U734_9MICO|nr:nitroreductase/quinone reductase family protein [Microbacterium aurum]APZ33916.1 hypothetical protein BOH66_06330 [Microbacterium aurum]